MRYSKRTVLLLLTMFFVLSVILISLLRPSFQELEVDEGLRNETKAMLESNAGSEALYIGTESGEVYRVSEGSVDLLYDFENAVHKIKFFENEMYLSVGSLEESSGAIRITKNGSEKFKFKGYTHGISASEDVIYVTNHAPSHGHEVDANPSTDEGTNSGSHSHSETGGGHTHSGTGNQSHSHNSGEGQYHKSGGGKVIIFDAKTGEEVKRLSAGSPHKLEKADDSIFVMDALGKIYEINRTNQSIGNGIELGVFIGDLTWENESVFVTYRKKVEQDLPDNIEAPRIKKGFVGIMNKNGTLEEEILLGKRTIPHDVEVANNKTFLVTDYLSGNLYFVENGSVSDVIDIGEKPVSLTVDGKLAYVSDHQEDVLYKVSIEERKVIDSQSFDDIHTVKSGPKTFKYGPGIEN